MPSLDGKLYLDRLALDLFVDGVDRKFTSVAEQSLPINRYAGAVAPLTTRYPDARVLFDEEGLERGAVIAYLRRDGFRRRNGALRRRREGWADAGGDGKPVIEV